MIFSCIILKFETKNNLDLSSVVKNLKIKEILNIAIFDKDYILLTIGFFVCGIQIVFIATHLPTYINDLGLSPYIAAWSLALVGLFNIIGSFLLGWLGSFLSKKKLLAWVYLLRSIFIVIFISLPPSETMALIFGCSNGFNMVRYNTSYECINCCFLWTNLSFNALWNHFSFSPSWFFFWSMARWIDI